MKFTLDSGVACYAVSKGDWDRGSLDGIVAYRVKTTQVFDPEHVVCDPLHPKLAGAWAHFAIAGWYGFLRGGTWVLLVQGRQVTIDG